MFQDADRESKKYIKKGKIDPSWAAREVELLIPASNLNSISGMQSTVTSMDAFVLGMGVGLTHTKKLLIGNFENCKGNWRPRGSNR